LQVLQVGGAAYLPGDFIDDQQVCWYEDPATGDIVEFASPPRMFAPESAAGRMVPADGRGCPCEAAPASGPGVVGASGPDVTPGGAS
jgi:hypothetical protein